MSDKYMYFYQISSCGRIVIAIKNINVHEPSVCTLHMLVDN